MGNVLDRSNLEHDSNKVQNRSPRYLTMSFTWALVDLLSSWDQGKLPNLSESLVRDRIPIILYHILVQAFQGQDPNGSWDGYDCPEVTSYAILTITKLSSLPWAESLKGQIDHALQSSKRYLSRNVERWATPGKMWIGKVGYYTSVISQGYCLAAMQSRSYDHAWSSAVQSLVVISDNKVSKFSTFLSGLPMFSDRPISMLKASVVEGLMFLQPLLEANPGVFKDVKKSKGQYLTYIPITWVAVSHIHGDPISLEAMWSIMNYSIIIFKIDEFVEGVIGQRHIHELDGVEAIIRRLQNDGHGAVDRSSNGISVDGVKATQELKPSMPVMEDVELTIGRLGDYILDHPMVRASPRKLQTLLRRELAQYLLASLDHLRYNSNGPQVSKAVSYFDWVRGNGADDISTIVSTIFFICVAQKSGTDSFDNDIAQYLIQAVARHLGTMSRMQNDFGSVRRDRAEGNLNSIDFIDENCATSDMQRKETLGRLIEFERSCLQHSFTQLKPLLPREMVNALAMWISMIELFGEIYAVKDLSTWLKSQESQQQMGKGTTLGTTRKASVELEREMPSKKLKSCS